MKTVPTLVTALNARAAEIYGADMIATSICYQMMCSGRMFWQAHICLCGRDSIFCEGATPQAAFDAAMSRIGLDTMENISAVLGYNVAA